MVFMECLTALSGRRLNADELPNRRRNQERKRNNRLTNSCQDCPCSEGILLLTSLFLEVKVETSVLCLWRHLWQ